MSKEKSAPEDVGEPRAPRPLRRVYRRKNSKKQPNLPAPWQATMVRESTRRRLENPLQEPTLLLQDSLAELRAVRKYREKEFAAIKTRFSRLHRHLFKMSADAHYLFHEIPTAPAAVSTVTGAPLEKSTGKRKRTREGDNREVGGEGEEEEEEEEEEKEGAPPKKRQRTRATQKVEASILRSIRKIAEESAHLKQSISDLGVEHERDVQRKMRDQLEDCRARMRKRDQDHDKMIAGWNNVRLGKDARTFVAAHVRRVPCRIQWSPMTAYDPPVNHEQATEAAKKKRKSLTVANFLQEKHGKRAATTATHPSKVLDKNKRVRRLIPDAQLAEGPTPEPRPAEEGGFDMSDHSADD